MASPYSADLREKALAAIASGHSIAAVKTMFDISRSSLSQWKKRYRKSGEIAAKQGYQRGHSHKITDWQAFRKFAEANGEKTQAEMAQLWPDEISEDTIGRALKHIGFTRKKRPMPTRNGMQPNAKSS